MTARQDPLERCRRCWYGGTVTVGDGHELMLCCTYRMRTGRARTCPRGEECTVFKERRNG